MAKFLNSSGITYHLENLIKSAESNLFLVSPYLKFNSKIKQLLDDRNNFRIDIKIIYGKVDLQAEESSWLKSMDSIKMLFCKNLHAKCYINEKEAIITSMNLYEFSQQNNNEMGIHVTKEEDPKLYQDIYDEVRSLIRTSDHVSLSIEKVETKKPVLKKEKKVEKKISKITNKGFCIRCKDNISLNLEHPYCKKCYSSWNKFADITYEEKTCHNCGKDNKSSLEKPVCYSCFKKHYK
jgi:phosphatidylserine/phosphatidylglycerophosphate/cardiolipin synthase-like enzyme